MRQDLDLGSEILPVERALGARWNVETDEFVFKKQLKRKSSIRRGLLSVVSSVYDPKGFISPFLLSAKINPSSCLPEKAQMGRFCPDRLLTSNSAVARVVASYGTIFNPAMLQA